MTKQRLLSIALVLLVVLNAITVCMLLRRPPHRGDHHPDRGPKWLVIERLGFDAEQISKYEDLIDLHRGAIDPLDEKMRSARSALFSGLRSPSSAQADSIADAIGSMQAEAERITFHHFAVVRALCRPEQRPRFDSLIVELSSYFGPHPPPDPPR